MVSRASFEEEVRKMTTLSFTRRSALRLIAAGFAFRSKLGPSLFEDTDEVNDVHSAVLEHAQKDFEERLEEEREREKARLKMYSAASALKQMQANFAERREKENFKLLVVSGETMCTCWLPPFAYTGGPLDPAELAEHYRLQHQFQPRFNVSKPYVVAPSKVLETAYQNRRAYPFADNSWQFVEEYPGCGGTYFELSPVRFNPKKTFAIATAHYRCSAGFIQASPSLWKRTGAHHWEPHHFTGDTQLDELGIPGLREHGLLGRLATTEMVKDLQERSMRCRKKIS
jgi:hypothetical protein